MEYRETKPVQEMTIWCEHFIQIWNVKPNLSDSDLCSEDLNLGLDLGLNFKV